MEIPGYFLEGSMERVTTVELDGGLVVYVIGIEDLIIDRLNAYKRRSSLNDGQWALAVLIIHYHDIDFAYLKKRAGEDGIQDVLEEIMDKAEKVKNSR